MTGIYPQTKLSIIGGGITAALEAYYAYLDAKKSDTKIRVSIYEKNQTVSETTAYNIGPSITPDELIAVVPRGKQLPESLGVLFSEPGGIRVADVPGVNNSIVAQKFIQQAQLYSQDEKGHQTRTQSLLALGKISMDLWQSIYEEADPELKQILEESNFNPCREPKQIESRKRHDGYRIDLIYNVMNAQLKAKGMMQDYQSLGYAHCNLLSPSQVKELDPFLAQFCDDHSEVDALGERQWKNDTVALFRPGGCIDAQIFLPKFYAYLEKVMGQYTNEVGKIKNCFHLHYERNVKGIECVEKDLQKTIDGLRFSNGIIKHNKHAYDDSQYAFCPGEAVGTLTELGLSEPAYAGFAGASLKLNVPIPDDQLARFKDFNHCMEVHKVGIVLAWQARTVNNKIAIAVAGTKAFYADQKPEVNQDFAKNRNLLQLNMLNDVLPEIVSIALDKDTKGQILTEEDLTLLEEKGIAKRWVGRRGVAYDGYPTLGDVYGIDGSKVANARTTTHLGSGGVSFGPAAVLFSRSVRDETTPRKPLVEEVLRYATSRRKLS